tara:strand:- start:428 stop:1585 length:1158 start_codon:yes stop_codon:yes gene_type:complete
MPLKVSDGIEAYIDDFQKSDAPQFKGKSKKERRDMAIAAYLTAKRGGKPQEENVKSADRKPEVYTKPDGKRGVRMVPVDREVVKTEAKVNELSPATMNRYKKAASRDQYHASSEIGRISSTPGLGKKYKDKAIGDAEKRREKRVRGLNLATRRSGTAGMQDEKHMVKDKKLKNLMVPNPKDPTPYQKAKKLMKNKQTNEETNFAVSIEGLPMMFMSADSPGMLKQTLRKIVKQPSMIKAVKRVTDAKVKKTFRLKAQGRDEEEVEENYKYDYGSPESIKLMKKVTPGQNKNEAKDPRLAKAGVSGYNKAKRTPGHPTKSHIVVAKDGDKVKTIRFGQQGVTTAGAPKKGESDKQKSRRKSFKARHAKNIAKGKMSAAYWADKEKW